jgi:hypothetical protein
MRKYSMRLNKVESPFDANPSGPQSNQIGEALQLIFCSVCQFPERPAVKCADSDKTVKISKLTWRKKNCKIPVLLMQHPAFLCVFKIGIK